jgi:branched-chain amino acid transport system permease protein
MSLLFSALVTGLVLGGLYALAATGLSLVYGVMRLVNLAHGGLVILAAYGAYVVVTALGLDPLVSLLVVVPAMFLIGWLLQRAFLDRLVRRGSLDAGMVTTLAIAFIIQTLLLQVFSTEPRTFTPPYISRGVPVLGVTVPAAYLLCLGVAVLVAGGLHALLSWTSIGRQVRAAAEDAETARLMGIRVERMYNLTFAAAAAVSAVAGVLIGVAFSFTPITSDIYLLKGFAVVVLGGLGSMAGTLIAALILGAVEGVGASVFGGGYRDLVTYAFFLLILILAPNGLFGRRSHL